MDRLSRDINRLENSVARYIYIKYIQDRAAEPTVEPTVVKDDSSDGGSSSYSSDDEAMEEVEDPQLPKSKPKPKLKAKAKLKAKVARPKVLDKVAYTIYRKNIFHQSRSCFALNQNDIIREDIRVMELADKAYEKHPNAFNVGDFELPPDVLRCSFIRKYHHRYYRCRNKIINKDSDICKKHENSENIYYDNYIDLLESLSVKTAVDC
jgi:hypothetical protein